MGTNGSLWCVCFTRTFCVFSCDWQTSITQTSMKVNGAQAMMATDKNSFLRGSSCQEVPKAPPDYFFVLLFFNS